MDLLQWFINFLIKNLLVVLLKIIQNEELVKELHKPIIRKFNKRKVYSSFIDNVCGADVVYIQLISKLNKRFRFLLMFIANVHGLFL